MLLFTKGLFTPPHHWLVAFEINAPVGELEMPTLHVLHNEQNLLKATKKDCDFIVEDIIKNLQKDKIKVKTVHVVDLGPVGSARNKLNRGLYRAKA